MRPREVVYPAALSGADPVTTPLNLSEKVLLITGPARGIGAATARLTAARGARLALVGMEPDLIATVAAELGPDIGGALAMSPTKPSSTRR